MVLAIRFWAAVRGASSATDSRGARQAPQRLTTAAAAAVALRLAAALTLAEAAAVAVALVLPEWADILIFLRAAAEEPVLLAAARVAQPLAW